MIDRRGLSLSEAAEYCGVSTATYRLWMARGIVPGYWPGTKRIDKVALQRALDNLSGLEQDDEDEFTKWLGERSREDRSAARAQGNEAPA